MGGAGGAPGPPGCDRPPWGSCARRQAEGDCHAVAARAGMNPRVILFRVHRRCQRRAGSRGKGMVFHSVKIGGDSVRQSSEASAHPELRCAQCVWFRAASRLRGAALPVPPRPWPVRSRAGPWGHGRPRSGWSSAPRRAASLPWLGPARGRAEAQADCAGRPGEAGRDASLFAVDALSMGKL